MDGFENAVKQVRLRITALPKFSEMERAEAWGREGCESLSRDIVRAVLQAIREPSEAMAEAGLESAQDQINHGRDGFGTFTESDAGTSVWQAMIDAALAELPQTETNPIGEA